MLFSAVRSCLGLDRDGSPHFVQYQGQRLERGVQSALYATLRAAAGEQVAHSPRQIVANPFVSAVTPDTQPRVTVVGGPASSRRTPAVAVRQHRRLVAGALL